MECFYFTNQYEVSVKVVSFFFLFNRIICQATTNKKNSLDTKSAFPGRQGY